MRRLATPGAKAARCWTCVEGLRHARVRTSALALLGALALGLGQGCSHVAPYEREQLAHPTMVTDDLARASEGHVRAVQEGAIGGGDAAGGGCGCN